MDTIRRGSVGDDVKVWQAFIGAKADGYFGSITDSLTREWQSAHRLKSDGVVGPVTWRAMCVVAAYPRPTFSPMTREKRALRFGSFSWEDADENGWIEIQDDWQKQHIVKLEIPELGDDVVGWNGFDFCHKLAADQIKAFFTSVDDAGLIHLVKSWGGCWAPRRIRTIGGFGSSLSNHAYGTAFDINVAWNQLGQVPALPGSTGSVIELLPMAYANGLYWGGLFSSQDGMHFQVDA